MRSGWQEVFIFYYFLKQPEDKAFIQLLVDGTEENIFGTLLLLAGRCICERDQDYGSETHRLVTQKLFSAYRAAPWLEKKRAIFEVIKQLPNMDLIEFIQEEINSNEQERRQQCIQFLRDLQSNEIVDLLCDLYENNVHITFNERNGIIDTIVHIELPLALNVLDRLMIKDSIAAERIIREMMITNSKRYINHILDNMKRSLYPEETREVILSQIGTAENLDQSAYIGIEAEFERQLNTYASDKSHLAKLIGWIKFSAPTLAPRIYSFLQSDHAGLRFAAIDFIQYQPDATVMVDALTNIYWGNNTSNEDRVKCLEVLLNIGESQESLVTMWLETQQMALEQDMVLNIYRALGTYGFGESFRYLETQLASRMHVNANWELIGSVVQNLYRIARNRPGIQPTDRSTIQYVLDLIPVAQANSDLCDAIVFLSLRYGDPSQQIDLLDRALVHRDISVAIIKYLASLNDPEFFKRMKPRISPILKALCDTEEILLIDYLFKIEENFLLEKSRNAQDQFIVSNLRSPNPFFKIRSIQRYEMDRLQEEAIEILTELLYSQKHFIKEQAIFLFGEMGLEITPLRNILHDPSYGEDAYRAIEKIARRKDQFGLRELKEMRNDYDY